MIQSPYNENSLNESIYLINRSSNAFPQAIELLISIFIFIREDKKKVLKSGLRHGLNVTSS